MTNSTPVEKKSSQAGRGLAFISFLIALLSLLGFVYLWLIGGAPLKVPSVQTLKAVASGETPETQNSAKFGQIEQRLSELQNSQQQGVSDLQSIQQQQQLQIKELGGTERKNLQVAEAEYLLRLANHRLQMAKDIEGSVDILDSADALLANQKDPGLYAIRQTIANEVSNLRAVERVDTVGLYSKLSALALQADQLPQFEAPKLAANAEQKKMKDDALLESLNEGSTETKASFAETIKNASSRSAKSIWRSIGVNYYSDFKAEPLLSSSEHLVFTQNLRLLFEQAKLAVLSKEQTIFKSALQEADQLLNRHAQKVAQARGMRDSIAELQQVGFQSQMPDISGSLRKLVQFQGREYKAPSERSAQQNGVDAVEQTQEQVVEDTTQSVSAEAQPAAEEQQSIENVGAATNDVQTAPATATTAEPVASATTSTAAGE